MKPSLTPNEDAVRAQSVPPNILKQMDSPGPIGAFSRVNVELMRSLMLAQAREIDRGTEQQIIISACAQVMGLMVSSLACGANATDVSPIEMAVEIMRRISVVAGEHVARTEKGEHDGDRIDATELARA